ncbi:MAG: D-alanyl-D-alanine carboxypeptidase/D-alanyl-D-alanine-endopeptidase [Acidobacteria bacterium]|nr:D-alanyl-D-alanine carboxypeptidase/D-alanyl-D-alanine-endopeptidase [Acidobacteriota bacterium]
MPPTVAKPALEAKPPADVAAFRRRVEAALSEARADKGTWAVLVTDAASGEVLFALHPQRYFMPASNTKLFTTALALATLGPDSRFRTTIETRGTLRRSGRLDGNLVLVGRGDPNLSNRKFPFVQKVERDGPPEKVLAELADAVVARGVGQIAGDILADDSYFSTERFPSGWTIDDMMWGYGAAVSALSVNDNTLVLELRPGEREGDPAWFGVEPWAAYYKIQSEVRTGPKGSERKLEVVRDPGSRVFLVRGTMPAGAEPHTLTFAVEEPAEHAAALLKRLLEARGVRVYGEARARHAPDTSPGAPTVLAEHVSVPLADAIRPINKMSLNLHAELLLRTAAREKVGAVRMEDALKLAQEFFKSAGIEEGDFALSDGSGLSRRDLVTPQAVVKLLQYVAQQPWAETFRSTLPVAGQDGTLEDRMKNTPAAGRIWAKTGTLEHVNALSGYATTLQGAKLIFSIFGNNYLLRSRDANGVIDAICVAMIEELGPPARAAEPPSPAKKP